MQIFGPQGEPIPVTEEEPLTGRYISEFRTLALRKFGVRLTPEEARASLINFRKERRTRKAGQ